MSRPSPKQDAVLAFWRAHHAEHGRRPTADQIREACGLASRAAAHQTILVLRAKGLIEPRERAVES